LGLFWTFDATRATSFNASSGDRDCVTIIAKLAPEHQGSDQIEPFLHYHEAEVRLEKGTPVILAGLFRNSKRSNFLRTELEGLDFFA
jgi:hypothetical protein